MNEFVYNALNRYFSALEKVGYYRYADIQKLLILIYLNELICDKDLHIPENDYLIIHRALACLYGSSCLIPYPDYLKKKECKKHNTII